MTGQSPLLPGTVLWIGPFYNRSGYGLGARASVLALHRAGVRVKTISVNEIEPGIDDCDLDLIKSLEATPVTAPITLVISHIPSDFWLSLKMPEPHLRIMNTTFDSSVQGNPPPPAWLQICNKMDQVWLMSENERDSFVAAGLPFEKTKVVYWPHAWVENPWLPPVTLDPPGKAKPFRFLSIAMFQPRRRWDSLIEAYLEEFRGDENVELYLKVNYPSWHPVPGKPRRDLHDMMDCLRKKTGSGAAITVDENLGTRIGVVHLMDSANVYVSTDTALTAPINEAQARHRLTIIPSSLATMTGYPCVAIDEEPDAKISITPEMLLYQPHHTGAFMPCLRVDDVRKALRRACDMSPQERDRIIVEAAKYNVTPAQSVSMMVKAVEKGWRYKQNQQNSVRAARNGVKRVVWEGSQFAGNSMAGINRELCLGLIDSGCELSIIPGTEVDTINPASDPRFEKILRQTGKPLSGEADVHVRHLWPPSLDPPPNGHWIMMGSWEYGRLPQSWVEPLTNQVDEIWVPGRHVQKTFISSGVPPECVQVIPCGVDSARFNPLASKLPIDSDRKFKFLFVGAAIWRKGFDMLLDAYRRAFTASDDVVLVVKDIPSNTSYRNHVVNKIIEEMKKDPRAPEILHSEAALAPSELAGLYTACDCLVHPYRAEGFAMPVLEAMACGLPVITTKGGAADDFCPPDYTFLLASRRVEFTLDDIPLAGGAGWVLEADRDELCALMRQVHGNPAAARQRALKFSEHIRAHYDSGRAVEIVKKRLLALSQIPIKRQACKTGLTLNEAVGMPCR